MLETYFFIPANNKRFIEKSLTLDVDYIVYDLEDSIADGELSLCLENLSKITIKENFYVRPRLFNSDDNHFNSQLISNLLALGFRNFLIPKFGDINLLSEISYEFKNIAKEEFDNLQFILLVETPKGILALNDAISRSLLNIVAIGFGSHDYSNILGCKHNLTNLLLARQTIILVARAHEIKALDIVNIDINNNEEFEEEVLNGFNMGFDGKFLIHPKQLEMVKSINYYSEDEIAQAYKVFEKLKNIQLEEFSLVTVDGKIYEKPHINRILKIVNWRKEYGSK